MKDITAAIVVIVACSMALIGSGYAISILPESSFSENEVFDEQICVLISDNQNNFASAESPQTSGLFSITMKQNSIIQFKPVYLKAEVKSSLQTPPQREFKLTVSSDVFPNMCFGSVSLCSNGPETAIPLDPNNKTTVNIVGNSVYKVMLETPNNLKPNNPVNFNVDFTITENVSQETV